MVPPGEGPFLLHRRLNMEYKSLPMFTKAIEDRTVTGLFAIHGNTDSYKDVSHPGSFSKTIAERGSKVKHLWNHDYYGGVPTAVVKSLREVTRDELPQEVLAMAPDATGGVEVVREYLDTPKGDEILKAIKAGAIDEMSYGYDPVKFDFAEINGQQIRNLREVKLWETSDVIFGANPATAASKWFMPLDLLLKQLEGWLEEIKAGARHSNADTKLLNSIHKAALELGATNCKGIVDEEAEAEGSEKSRADLPSLTLLKSELEIFALETSLR